MPDKKLTDNKILKDLDEAELFLRNRVMDGMSLKLNEYDIGILRNISQVCAKAYDEINSLQAENERLEAECEEQYESAEATIRAEIASGGTSCHWCEDKVRIEAYKECIEKIYKFICDTHNWGALRREFLENGECYWLKQKLNNLLKELVGDK